MRLLVMIACSFLLYAGGVQATSPIVEAYKAYAEALAQGDVLTAEREGEKAWQEAEKANNKNYSAILAYNLAQLRIRYLPREDAITPAKRALALSKSLPDGALTVQSTQLINALAIGIGKPNRSNVKALKLAISDFTSANLEPNYPLFHSHIVLTTAAGKRRNWGEALQQSTAAQSIYNTMEMQNAPILASLKLFEQRQN